MTTTSVMTLFPSTKDQINSFVEDQKSRILSGNTDIKQIAVLLKCMEDTIESLRKDKDIREVLINEVSRYGKGECVAFGGEFEVREMGVKYDYSACNDPEWNYLKKELEKRQEFLKALKEATEYDCMNYETGEIEKVKLNPVVKTSTTTVAVKLK